MRVDDRLRQAQRLVLELSGDPTNWRLLERCQGLLRGMRRQLEAWEQDGVDSETTRDCRFVYEQMRREVAEIAPEHQEGELP
jgi:hypothetical protein